MASKSNQGTVKIVMSSSVSDGSWANYSKVPTEHPVYTILQEAQKSASRDLCRNLVVESWYTPR